MLKSDLVKQISRRISDAQNDSSRAANTFEVGEKDLESLKLNHQQTELEEQLRVFLQKVMQYVMRLLLYR